MHLLTICSPLLPPPAGQHLCIVRCAGCRDKDLTHLVLCPRPPHTQVNDQHLYIVVNAGCRDKDLTHLAHHLDAAKAAGKDVSLEVHDDRGLLAVQGPKAVQAVQALTSADLSKLYFSNFRSMDIAGAPVWVTRTGYTGEDGFEISVPNSQIVKLAEALLAQPDVKLNGLGSRDSLRLEAGLCLYGNDLTEDITPVEAGLAWTGAALHVTPRSAPPPFPTSFPPSLHRPPNLNPLNKKSVSCCLGRQTPPNPSHLVPRHIGAVGKRSYQAVDLRTCRTAPALQTPATCSTNACHLLFKRLPPDV
eukprot:324334-Chlamydomonas_euryale.AAC.9